MAQLPPAVPLCPPSILGTLREQHLHVQKAAEAAAGRCCRGSPAAGEKLCSPGPRGRAAVPKPCRPAVIASQRYACVCRNLPTGELATQRRKSQTLKNNKGFFAYY